MPANAGLRSNGASKNWEKCISWQKPVKPREIVKNIPKIDLSKRFFMLHSLLMLGQYINTSKTYLVGFYSLCNTLFYRRRVIFPDREITSLLSQITSIIKTNTPDGTFLPLKMPSHPDAGSFA